MAHLVPSPPGSGNYGLARTTLLSQTMRRLVEEARGAPLVLGIDDAHFLDELSATLAHQLAYTRSAFVLVTLCVGAPVPPVIGSLVKDGVAAQLNVGPLREEDSRQLLERVVQGQLDGATAGSLWRLTQGNVMYLREVVHSGLESGVFALRDGLWRWDGPFTARPQLRDLIQDRMGSLEPAERACAELLAFGEPLGPAPLNRILGKPSLDCLERKGLLRSQSRGRRIKIRLRHPLYAEMLRAAAPRWRRQEVYAQLADALESTGTRRAGDVLRLADWRLRANQSLAPPVMLDAAETAIGVDDATAERLARQALRQGETHRARILLARALLGLGRTAEAEDVLAIVAPEPLTDAEVAAFATLRAANLFWSLGQPDAAMNILAQAEARVSEPAALDRITTLRATFELHAGNCVDALAALDDLLAEEHGEDHVRLQVLVAAGTALCLVGRCRRAIEVTGEGLQLDAVLPDTTGWERLQLESSRCSGFVFAGRLDDAERMAFAGYRQAIRRGAGLEASMYALWLGHLARLHGDLEQSLRWLKEADQDRGSDFFAPSILSDLAHTAALLGDIGLARDAQKRAEHSLLRSSPLFEVSPLLSRVWVEAASGRITQAIGSASRAAGVAAPRGPPQFEVVALHDMVRLGAAAPRTVARLVELARAFEGDLTATCAAHALAAAARDGDQLDKVADRFARLDARLLAAETAAQAAEAHQRTGRVANAAISANAGREWATGCRGARTPALTMLMFDALGVLTPRQREIAQLAANGLTSIAIADRLMLSSRTVDNTLRQVFARLGVPNRRELRELLGGSES
jgi:DNA-binding CsgD family transcriptional regulator